MKQKRPGIGFYLEVGLVGALVLYRYASALFALWAWIIAE